LIIINIHVYFSDGETKKTVGGQQKEEEERSEQKEENRMMGKRNKIK
jgi:hypothetical protein